MVFFPNRTTTSTIIENATTQRGLTTEPKLCSQKMKRQSGRGAVGVPKNTVTKAIRLDRVKVPLISSPDTKVLIKKTMRTLATLRVAHRAMMTGKLRANVIPPIIGIRILKAAKTLGSATSLQFPEPLVQFSITQRHREQMNYT